MSLLQPLFMHPGPKRSGPTDHTFHWVGGSHSVKHHTRMKLGAPSSGIPRGHACASSHLGVSLLSPTAIASESVTAHEDLQAEVDSFAWFHSIDLGDGVVTRGLSELQLREDQLPDFSERSVLDIGAWDGYYSFLAERNGASRVVALDHYAWGVDIEARDAYWKKCAAEGVLPDHERDATDFWRTDLPGRRGFELASRALNSEVEPIVADFTTADLAPLGTYDVVLYLGVLYHMKEPLTCLERVRAVTNTVAVIETEAVHLNGLDHESLLQFHAGGDVQTDFGNWFIPTIEALKGLCRAAGFSRVEVVAGPPPKVPATPPGGRRAQLKQMLGTGPGDLPPVSAPSAAYRALVHAYV